MEPVLTSIAGKLAGALASAALPKMKAAVLGTDEQRAIDRAFRSAFAAMLTDMRFAAPDDAASDDVLATAEAQLSDFVSDPEAAAALLQVALERKDPPLALLKQRFSAVGFDPSTFAVDFDLAMTRLAQRLTESLRSDAQRANGKLFNQVALTEFELLHERLTELTRKLSDAAVPAPAGTAPPASPGLFVGREHDVAVLKRMIDRRSVSVLRGWPGVGKTTLAATLAYDPDVRREFGDGVLWAAVGRRERVPIELAGWAQALGEQVAPTDGIEQLSARIRARLDGKRVLVLVDDVWDSVDAAPFLVAGPSGATLVTTRVPAVAGALAPTPDDVYVLAVLADTAALELLGILVPSVVADHPEEAAALVRELEGLPLAIRVAGRLLHAEAQLGWGVEALLADIRQGARLLEAQAPADRAELADHTIPSVAALLQRSTDLLDADTRRRFAYLGAFAPKPAIFDLSDLSAAWELDDPRPTTRTLADRGLVEAIGAGEFQIHSLLVMHATSLLRAL